MLEKCGSETTTETKKKKEKDQEKRRPVQSFLIEEDFCEEKNLSKQ